MLPEKDSISKNKTFKSSIIKIPQHWSYFAVCTVNLTHIPEEDICHWLSHWEPNFTCYISNRWIKGQGAIVWQISPVCMRSTCNSVYFIRAAQILKQKEKVCNLTCSPNHTYNRRWPQSEVRRVSKCQPEMETKKLSSLSSRFISNMRGCFAWLVTSSWNTSV